MKIRSGLFLYIILVLASSLLCAQSADGGAAADFASGVVHRADHTLPTETMILPHLVHGEARHPKAGCEVTAVCGELFSVSDTTNIRTSAGTTWESQRLLATSTPADDNRCNYMALTNSAITPAFADTTLTGEISSNGLARAQGTYTDSSGVIATAGAPTVAPQGTTGATTLWYNVLGCGQGICASIGTSTQTTTANATLSATNYVHVSWTPVAGATSYYLLRNTSNSFSGTLTAVAGRDSTSQPDCSTGTCAMDDIANTLAGTSVAVPASNLTNYGHATLAHTWTATATQAFQAGAIFTAASSGTECFEFTLAPVTLNGGDSYVLTELVQF